MSYHHFIISERESILEFSAKGMTIRAIALWLKRSPRSVSREMNWLPGRCSSSKSQKNYRAKRCHSYKPRMLDQKSILCQKVIELIEEHQWSPEQIAKRMVLENYGHIS